MARDKPAALIASSAASFILAAIAGTIAFFLLWATFDTVQIAGAASRARGMSRGIGMLGLIGFVAAGAALLFQWVGLNSAWDASRGKGGDDEYDQEKGEAPWKRFPAPKD